MRHMATEELNESLRKERRLQNLLFRSLLPKDDADHRDCILEVRAGFLFFFLISLSILINCLL